MGEAFFVFVAGIGGVFVGMAFLIVSIRVTSLVARLLGKKNDKLNLRKMND